PDFNLAMLIALVYLIHRMFVYIGQMQGIAHSISSCSPYLQSVVKYSQEASREREAAPGGNPFHFEKELRFDNVSFGYGRKKIVLYDVSFTLKKGEIAGLIGPSGVGKTTLVDLLLRLLEPTSGQVLLDGRQAQDIEMNDWRRQFGYMSQDIFLLNDTIANNIRFYDPHISDEDIRDAARLANLEQFIAGLPAQYETVVGERGIELSGGERQRVVLARVLARHPQILILDEATSSLDNESEAEIQKVIKSLGGRVTILIIAHRLSTIADVEQMIVLDQGRVAEIGHPSELLADANSYYSRMQKLAK
ncbi:MAG: ATP-binding cassette domain-containing protein, partial [bacterium]|nr:ATP-binding cassette domain-containing protein [bacterium]